MLLNIRFLLYFHMITPTDDRPDPGAEPGALLLAHGWHLNALRAHGRETGLRPGLIFSAVVRFHSSNFYT